MHFSGSNRSKILSAAMLGVLGLAIMPSLAQNTKPGAKPLAAVGGLPVGGGSGGGLPIGGGGGGSLPVGGGQPNAPHVPIPRWSPPPHAPLRTPAAVAAYIAKLRQTPRPPKLANLRAAMKHIATMPVYGDGGDGGNGGAGGLSLKHGGSAGNSGGAGNGSLQSLLAPPAVFNPLAIYTPPVSPIAPVSTWMNIGPIPLQPYDQTYFGPSYVTGRINALVFDPTNSSVEYIAAPVGGIWKTVNAGQTWTPITDTLPTQSFSSITIDPANHNVLYAGSGDYDGTDESGAGLFRSQDGGATWTNLDPDGSIFADHAIRSVLIDPTNDNHVLVAVGRGGDSIFTTDGGIVLSTNAMQSNTPTFTSVLRPGNRPFDGNCRTLVYSADRSIVYAACESADGPVGSGVFVSRNNGATWTHALTTGFFTDVAASTVNNARGVNTVYAADGSGNAILKSIDGGSTWTDVTGNFPQAIDPQTGSDGVWDQAFYDFYISTAQRPGNLPGDFTSPVDVVYVGLKDVYQSSNGAQTWTSVGQVSVAPNFTFNDQMHTDQHGIGIDPNDNNNVIFGNDGGVYRLRYTPAVSGFSLSDLNASLCVTEFYQTVFHPTSADTILGGTQDNGTNYSFGSLRGFAGVTGGDGGGVAINAMTPSTMYSCYPGSGGGPAAFINVNLTDDNWQTVTSISHNVGMENVPFVQVIALDPQNYDHLYAGSNNLWLYDHAAKNWTEILDENSNNKPLTGGTVSAIAPSGIPARGNEPIVYVGCSGGEVYSFVPAGDNPTGAYTVQKLITLRGSITSITVSKANASRIFVTTSAGEVYRCNNAISTNNFIDITGTAPVTDPTHLPVLLPVNTLAVGTGVPPNGTQEDEQLLYVGTDLGVFVSTNGGQTWGIYSTSPANSTLLDTILPLTRVTNLDVNTSTGFLSAGTFGRGIWRTPLGNKTTIHYIPQWQNYRGSKNNVRVTVEVRPVNTPNTTLPVEVKTVYTNNAGAFDVTLNSRGHFDIYIKIPRFLRHRDSNILTTLNPTLQPLILIGDVDNDNAVTQADLALIRAALGSFTTGLVDLDGDGRVTSNDYNIAAQNLNRVGD